MAAVTDLIVTADDFGLTDGVCTAILDAHRAGTVTATSVLAMGPAFDRHARALVDVPTLEAGLHLAFVGEDPPVLGASEIPTLVDRRGAFPLDWRRFCLRVATGRVDPDDLRREAEAQFEVVRQSGVAVRHVNCHQHLQLVPVVGRVVIALATVHAIPVVRVPRGDRPGLRSALVTLPGRRLGALVDAAPLSSPSAVVGLTGAGAMVGDQLERTLARVAGRTGRAAELVVHPGGPDDPQRGRYRWGYRWVDEWRTLTDGTFAAGCAERGISLAAPSTLVA